MNKEIKIKVIKLFVRFLKEKELYNDLIKEKKNFNFENFDNNQPYFDIKNAIENVPKLNITYFEEYANCILNELGYTYVSHTLLRIENEWLNYCKTHLLKQNVNEIWELFKQTEDYKSNEYLIQKYNNNNNHQYPSYIKKEILNMNCLVIHAKYISDVMDILKNSVNIAINEYQRLCNELESLNFMKKWKAFYENNVELKF